MLLSRLSHRPLDRFHRLKIGNKRSKPAMSHARVDAKRCCVAGLRRRDLIDSAWVGRQAHKSSSLQQPADPFAPLRGSRPTHTQPRVTAWRNQPADPFGKPHDCLFARTPGPVMAFPNLNSATDDRRNGLPNTLSAAAWHRDPIARHGAVTVILKVSLAGAPRPAPPRCAVLRVGAQLHVVVMPAVSLAS